MCHHADEKATCLISSMIQIRGIGALFSQATKNACFHKKKANSSYVPITQDNPAESVTSHLVNPATCKGVSKEISAKSLGRG